MNPRIWCFDLEMNQPSRKIIQIGGLVGHILTGEVIETFNYYINPHEQVDPFITELTGIKNIQAQSGIELKEACQNIETLIESSHCCKMPIVWGNGDLRQLKTESENDTLKNIHRELDIKTIHQFLCLSRGLGMRGGLEKSLMAYNLKFKGVPHNALDDAINTFRLAVKLQELFKYSSLTLQCL